ncbi:MAG: glycoside hydrolase [Acidithiobacillus sp.]|uniref:glycoside hydrolase family 57 protein n=1 Tax=Acidithiobacillus TaxID=119977 RepID=UPI001C07B446|nr:MULTISPECIES: glycoside hydrolase family 57 protein [Acidithiobacillus]MBU2783055.1 glycoside hydrolase [Acidithiobacillus caldus]MCE5420419.1 glycoside hydrolase [Acidithiobacillus sp.]
MPPARALHVILCWHMHQPDYRDGHGEYRYPWTYLHACKDYTDMVAHLEENPAARAVFNFVPVLVEQLQDYVEQFAEGRFRDPLLRVLASEDLENLAADVRHYLLEQCFRLDREHMLNPFPGFRRLYELWQFIRQDASEMVDYLSVQYVADLVVWYHLAWTGETVRRQTPLIQELMAKGSGYSWEDRQNLLRCIGDLLAGLLPRYRALVASGRIEISTTPYEHPIAPLLLDFAAAQDGEPDAQLPNCPAYPGGEARVHWQVDAALERHCQDFGMPPQGLWPAEGGISAPFVEILAGKGLQWTATGEGILARSLSRSEAGDAPARERHDYLYRPYRLRGEGPWIFFRDDALSDAIGFDYKSWFGHDAVTDFVQRLEAIWRATENQAFPVVSIILDGENAWEYYPYNGYYFLSELYRALANHPHLQLCTFRDFVRDHPEAYAVLPQLAAGSWVYGSFSTWIGDPAKNRAWDLLCSAKKAVDEHLPALAPEQQNRVRKQLALCEGSDWFWWFGDYNPAESVRDFDRLYRAHLRELYRLLALAAPAELDQPISQGGAPAEAGGTMRRSHHQGD